MSTTDRMAPVRAAMLTKAVATARERAAQLGLTLTDEQADEAGRRILHSEQASRAAEARASLAAKRAEREQTFAIRQAKQYAQQYIDLWGGGDEAAHGRVLRHMLDVASEECLAPDGFKASRLTRRLDLALNEARTLSWVTTAQLDATILPDLQPDWDALQTADDIAAEEGIAPWAAR